MSNSDKEFFYTDFNSLGHLVNKVVQDSNLRQGIKKTTIFKFWSKVVGKKFEKYSKIEAINQQNVLIVACANSMVSSELTMFKSDILKKINGYAKPLGIEIIDINFSHKIWKKEVIDQEINVEEKNPYKKDLTGFNADEIVLDNAEIESVKKSVMNNTFATEEQRRKMFDAIILDLKIQKYVNEILPHRQP